MTEQLIWSCNDLWHASQVRNDSASDVQFADHVLVAKLTIPGLYVRLSRDLHYFAF